MSYALILKKLYEAQDLTFAEASCSSANREGRSAGAVAGVPRAQDEGRDAGRDRRRRAGSTGAAFASRSASV
jgi:hypothetical protein